MTEPRRRLDQLSSVEIIAIAMFQAWFEDSQAMIGPYAPLLGEALKNNGLWPRHDDPALNWEPA